MIDSKLAALPGESPHKTFFFNLSEGPEPLFFNCGLGPPLIWLLCAIERDVITNVHDQLVRPILT